MGVSAPSGAKVSYPCLRDACEVEERDRLLLLVEQRADQGVGVVTGRRGLSAGDRLGSRHCCRVLQSSRLTRSAPPDHISLPEFHQWQGCVFRKQVGKRNASFMSMCVRAPGGTSWTEYLPFWQVAAGCVLRRRLGLLRVKGDRCTGLQCRPAADICA